MEILLWRIIKKKLLKRSETKTKDKILTKDEAIDHLLRKNNYFHLGDGKYQISVTETIKASETKKVSSLDVVLDEGKIKVVPTVFPAKEPEETVIGVDITMDIQTEDGKTETIPFQFEFLDKSELEETE